MISWLEQIEKDIWVCSLDSTFEEDSKSCAIRQAIEALEQEPKIGHCKNCKYFEYDSVEMVHGLPIIVAHEICKRWGNGCKTREDGYCHLFETPESEDRYE